MVMDGQNVWRGGWGLKFSQAVLCVFVVSSSYFLLFSASSFMGVRGWVVSW